MPATENWMRVAAPEERAVGKKVSRFLPTPLALLAVTSHAPTNDGLDVATRIGALFDGFDSGLAQEDKTGTRNDCKNADQHPFSPFEAGDVPR